MDKGPYKNDIVIMGGMPRGASTWIFRNLSLHPYANMSELKETNFFSLNFDKGFSWYYNLYNKDTGDQHIKFDISPFYFLCHDFLENIKLSGASPKIILVLREPNEWVQSFYYQTKSYNLRMSSFEQFITEHSFHFDGKKRIAKFKEFDFVGRVKDYCEQFKGNILLINFNQIQENPVAVLQEIEKFSGLPNYFNKSTIISSQINASQANFSFLNMLSTLGIVRKVSDLIPFRQPIIRYFQKIIYKEKFDKLAGISTQKQSADSSKYTILAEKKEYIDSLFPPEVYKNTFFQESDFVYL